MLIELAVRPYYHALYFVLFEFIPLISPIRMHSVFIMAASEEKKKREKKTDFLLTGELLFLSVRRVPGMTAENYYCAICLFDLRQRHSMYGLKKKIW